MVEILGWLVICIVVADLVVGCVHWMEDTYCSDDTVHGRFLSKFVGHYVCEENIEHHVNPRKMVGGSFFHRNLLPWSSALVASLLLLLTPYSYWQAHLVFWISSFGNEVHLWSHLLEKELNPFQRFLKEAGIVQDKRQHMLHHKWPYTSNYCVLIQFNNAWMERVNFWRKLEFILSIVGIHPQRENRRDSK